MRWGERIHEIKSVTAKNFSDITETTTGHFFVELLGASAVPVFVGAEKSKMKVIPRNADELGTFITEYLFELTAGGGVAFSECS